MGAGIAGAVVLAWLVVLAAYDIRERRLPNWLTLPGAVVILSVATAVGRGLPALLGALALFVVYLVAHLLAGVGAGDVKLAVGVGALTAAFGFDVWALAALGAPLLSAGCAVVEVVRRRGSVVPHGPSMCIATLAATTLAVV